MSIRVLHNLPKLNYGNEEKNWHELTHRDNHCYPIEWASNYFFRVQYTFLRRLNVIRCGISILLYRFVKFDVNKRF